MKCLFACGECQRRVIEGGDDYEECPFCGSTTSYKLIRELELGEAVEDAFDLTNSAWLGADTGEGRGD